MRRKAWIAFLLFHSCARQRLKISDCQACVSKGGECALGDGGAFLCLIPVSH
jgi:hypothetical protein